MAFDGIVISNIVKELSDKLIEGRIYKIYQPEPDEIVLIIKNNKENYRLRLSANASLPLIYLTYENKGNPMTAPNFCMLLRKHIGNGRIKEITQPGFERIVAFSIEHMDEMGDLCVKKLLIEIMGKHSNIIFINQDQMIIDSIKHIGAQMSSVREVLPGREYVLPPNQDKISPLTFDRGYFDNVMKEKPMPAAKAIYTSLTGFSFTVANAICYEAGVEGNRPLSSLSVVESDRLYEAIDCVIREVIKSKAYCPCIYYDGYEPVEFSSMRLASYEEKERKDYDSISEVLETYYAKKNTYSRIHQKSQDLRRIVSSAVERTAKKLDLQNKQMKDTMDMDRYRIYGELLQTYGYEAKEGDKEITVINYYDNKELTIPLDETMTAMENSVHYFEKYNKKKRTKVALDSLITESENSLSHLLSVQNALTIAETEADLYEIKQELIEAGYIKAKGGKNKRGKMEKSKPLHFVSSDGYHMYVGKNNLQNDYLTFTFASGKDMWFHAKKMPGSHVIVKVEGDKELPDQTYEEAARLAAFYSSGREGDKVEIDYTKRMQLKKPPKSNPGYVIYHTNYSMMASPDIHGIEEIKE